MAHILTKIKFLHMILFYDQFYEICAEQETPLSPPVQGRETSSKNVKKRNINAVAKKNFSEITSAIRRLFIRWTEFECLMYQNKDISSRVRWITSLRQRCAFVRTLRVQKCMHTLRTRDEVRSNESSDNPVR